MSDFGDRCPVSAIGVASYIGEAPDQNDKSAGRDIPGAFGREKLESDFSMSGLCLFRFYGFSAILSI